MASHTYNVQASGQGAKSRMAAAAGAGFEGSLFTGPQGTGSGPTTGALGAHLACITPFSIGLKFLC
jgi:hypothetical protein